MYMVSISIIIIPHAGLHNVYGSNTLVAGLHNVYGSNTLVAGLHNVYGSNTLVLYHMQVCTTSIH